MGVFLLGWAIVMLSFWTIGPYLKWVAAAFVPISVDFDEFSLWASWAPLAAKAARGSLLLSDSTSGYYPYLTVWFHGLAVALLGQQAAFAWGGFAFSVLALILLTAVYHEYLPLGWSAALAALGGIVFTNWPLREFLVSLISGHGWRDVGPAIGLPFWFTLLALKLWRNRRGSWEAASSRLMAAQFALALLLSAPAIWGLFTTTHDQSFGLLSSTVATAASGSLLYYHLVYVGLPLLLLMGVATLKRIDLYEIGVRFWPVWILMASYLVAMDSAALMGIPRHLLTLRLGVFFIHLLPYVPVIDFLLRPEVESSGRRDTPLAPTIRRAVQWFVGPASTVYLPLLFLVLIGYAWAGADAHWQLLEQQRVPSGRVLLAQNAALIEGAEPGTTLLAPDAAGNLILPSCTPSCTWPSLGLPRSRTWPLSCRVLVGNPGSLASALPLSRRSTSSVLTCGARR